MSCYNEYSQWVKNFGKCPEQSWVYLCSKVYHLKVILNRCLHIGDHTRKEPIIMNDNYGILLPNILILFASVPPFLEKHISIMYRKRRSQIIPWVRYILSGIWLIYSRIPEYFVFVFVENSNSELTSLMPYFTYWRHLRIISRLCVPAVLILAL